MHAPDLKPIRHRAAHALPVLRRRIARGLAWLLAVVMTPAAPAAADDPTPPAIPLIPAYLNVGFTQTVFAQTNRNDIEAAFKALAEIVGRKRGYDITVTTRFFAGPDTFGAAIRDGSVNLAVFDSLTYVVLADSPGVTPVFVTVNEGTPGRRFSIVVRRDRGVTGLAGLRGADLVELEAPNLGIGHAWLQRLLWESGFPAHDEFFREVEYVGKASAAVLPVFFGKRTACLVDDLAFKTMCELNPQVGAQLHAIVTSEPMVGSVISVNHECGPQAGFRDALLQTLAELHIEVAGRQILALFRIDALAPFEDAQLASVRRLRADHQRLLNRLAERRAGS